MSKIDIEELRKMYTALPVNPTAICGEMRVVSQSGIQIVKGSRSAK